MKKTICSFGPFAIGAALTVLATGCGGSQSGPGAGGAPPGEVAKQASATIEGKSGANTGGTALLSSDGKTVTLELDVVNAPPGTHAVHIHEFPDCSAPDAESAGGHWNPTKEDHGKWGNPPFHLGDIGNLTVGDDGRGSLKHSTDLWSVATGDTDDVVDHSIVIHTGADDFTSQPSGAAGARIGCGVIKRQ